GVLQFADIDTTAGNFFLGSFSATLGPGQHTITFKDNGGSDPVFVVNSLEITGDPMDGSGSGPLFEDFGDAPDLTYPTLLASNGASHITGGLTLGATVDKEMDGQPNVTATGDGADEDGVTFLSPFVANGTAAIQVNVTGAPAGGAKLDAWIDWNQ